MKPPPCVLPTATPELLARIRVVLSHPSHPGNVGAAARAMKTMGLSQLWLINPQRFPHQEAIARAAGAADVLEAARICPRLDDALGETVFACAATARHRQIGPPAIVARQAAAELVANAGHGEVALLFGNETAGLANAEVLCCQRVVHIPANPDYSSLNLAAAVQVMAYELRLATLSANAQAGDPSPTPTGVVATRSEIEHFHQHLERVMIASGFLDPQRPKRLLPKLRRLFARAELDHNEVNILRGLLDAVERKLG